jgi:hypothetical protein
MPRRNAKRSPRESAPQAKPRQPWQECASNKHKKKRIVEGQPISSRKRPAKRHTAPCTTDPSVAVISSLVECFSDVEDPRIKRQRRHLLIDIIVIGMLAVMCNADGWKEIYLWGDANHKWLQTFLELPNGIPSRDTFRRTISRLNP